MVDNMFNDYKYIEDIDNDDRLENLIATGLLLEDKLKENDIINAINIAGYLIDISKEKEGFYE